MTIKFTEANLRTVVSLVASGVMTKARHCEAVDVSDETLRSWEFRSNNSDPAFAFDFFGTGEPIQFAQALAIAQKFAYREMRAAAEQFSIHGRKRRTLAGGQFVIKLDRKALALSVEDRELLGYHRDAYDLDEDGAVQWVTELEMAPVGLMQTFLQTFKDLQTTTHQSVDVRGGLQVGVRVAKPTDYSKSPPPIPPMPIPPMLEVLPDLELDELLGPDEAYAACSTTSGTNTAPHPDLMTTSSPDEPDEVFESVPLPPLPPAEPEIRDMPTARETPPPQPLDSILGKTPANLGPWREQWEALQARASLPNTVSYPRGKIS